MGDYELYCRISKYELTIGVELLKRLEENEKNYKITTDISQGIIRDSSVIVSDVEEELPLYFEELRQKNI